MQVYWYTWTNMPRASKFSLRQKQFEEMNSHLLYLISSLNNKSEIEDFIESFLTKEEKIMLTKRLVLFMMLHKEYSPSIIKNTLHISYETIRIYQNQLISKNKTFQKLIENLLKRQESLNFFKSINKLLKPLDLAFNSKRNMKARAKFASGNFS